MQHSRTVVLLVLLACICHRVASLAINVQADTQECFFEDLDVGDKMTVTFQVGDGGNLDIDFWISDPAERVIKSGIRETTGTHEVVANLKGRHTYCFSNRMSSVSDKSVSFNVHDVQKQGADSVNIDPLEREIRELAESMSAVKDEQEYIVIRERQHRDTAESTNARVKWWSLGQLGLLVGVCFWQIFYLKRFFEVKRVV
ncbi:p24 complex component [Umbelopsis sp. WA50703]